ncbi:MAG: hypothetical protein LBH32_11965 [Dysgonamonadaceae bacterium]|jgi:hypothetical protein|nr:hypothetical protein [Dysgonamonadaceae bacterium]
MKRNRILRIKSLSNGLIAAAFALVCAQFVSCEKDKKKTDTNYTVIAIEVENSSSSISTVKATVQGVELASAKYSNSGFTVKLPVPDDDLLVDELMCTLDGYGLSAYNGNSLSGYIWYYTVNQEEELTIGQYWYFDSNITLNDSEDGLSIDISCKQGWNLLYFTTKDLQTGTLTSKKISGLRWIYLDESSFGLNKKSAEMRSFMDSSGEKLRSCIAKNLKK